MVLQTSLPTKKVKIAGQSVDRWLMCFCNGLPSISGSPIALSFQPSLTAYRGKLIYGDAKERGTSVYAASFIRRREIVLDDSLVDNSILLRIILIHELGHFVWVRLNNRSRQMFEAVLSQEQCAGAKGELGDSSSIRKEGLRRRDVQQRTRLWREYVCESFCDTFAWRFSGVTKHRFFKLPMRCRHTRIEVLDGCLKTNWLV